MLKYIDRLAEWWLRRRPTNEQIEIHVKNGVFPKSRIRSGDAIVVHQGAMGMGNGIDLSDARLASLTISPVGMTRIEQSSSLHCPVESPAPQS